MWPKSRQMNDFMFPSAWTATQRQEALQTGHARGNDDNGTIIIVEPTQRWAASEGVKERFEPADLEACG